MVRNRVADREYRLKDAPRDQQKERQAEKAVRHDPVEPFVPRRSRGFRRIAAKCLPRDARYEVPPLEDHGRLEVVFERLFDAPVFRDRDCEDRFRPGKTRHGSGISFGRPDREQPPFMVRHVSWKRLRDRGQGALHLVAVKQRERLVLPARRGAPRCKARGDLPAQLVEPRSFGRGRRDDVDAQERFEARDIHRDPLLFREIPHIQRDDDRDARFPELRRKVEAALDIRRVDDSHHRPRTFVPEEVRRDLFVDGGRAEAVHAGKVHERDLARVEREPPLLALDRDARPVADLLTRAGQRVEQARLSRIRVSRERDDGPAHTPHPPHPQPPPQEAQPPLRRTSIRTAAASERRRLSSKPRTRNEIGSASGADRSRRTSVPGTSPISMMRCRSAASPSTRTTRAFRPGSSSSSLCSMSLTPVKVL